MITARDILEQAYTLVTETVIVTSPASGRTYNRSQWTRGREHRVQPLSDGRVLHKYCSLGLINAAGNQLLDQLPLEDRADTGFRWTNFLKPQMEAKELLARAIELDFYDDVKDYSVHRAFDSMIIAFNDKRTRKLPEVQDVFAKAIKLAIEEQERADE